MPTFDGITVSLQSQYDAATIPEWILLPPAFPASEDSLDLLLREGHDITTLKTLPGRILNISIQTLPSSQFWITYAALPPTPPEPHTYDPEIRFFYFKLYVAGECVLSWGVGEQDNWSGKTMHALFAARTDFEGKRVVEKRGLFFPKPGTTHEEGDGFEVQVFRAKERKQEAAAYDQFHHLLRANRAALDFVNIGHVKQGERQRMYTYALIDPKDEPYVTFRYRFRSDCLSAKGQGSSDVTASSSALQIEQQTLPMTAAEGNNKGERRLSLPPLTRFAPTTRFSEPSSPIKRDTAPRDGRAHEEADHSEHKRHEWFVRTPSPLLSRLFDQPTSPPTERSKVSSRGLLRDVATCALKRTQDKLG